MKHHAHLAAVFSFFHVEYQSHQHLGAVRDAFYLLASARRSDHGAVNMHITEPTVVIIVAGLEKKMNTRGGWVGGWVWGGRDEVKKNAAVLY
jgi:hypothetical protein